MKNALSLFNGISGCHLALERAGLSFGTVYYSEIDKYANAVTQHHYPNDVALGDVTKWREWDIDWASIDLIGAGFPCQAWSVAGKQLGDKDERGMLFWTTLEIIAKVLKHNPNAKFLMENVKMKKEFEEYITYHTEQALGHVEKTLINSALVSAQNRQRYYWTNFEVTQPDDKGVLLKDIIEDGENNRDKSQTILATIYKENAKSMIKRNKMGLVVMGGAIRGRYNADGSTSQKLECNGKEKTNSLTTVQKDNVIVYNTADNPRIKGILKPTASKTDTVTTSHAPKVLVNESATKQGKSYTLTASQGNCVAWNSCERKQRTMVPMCLSDNVEPNVYNGILYRKLTPLECERLQTIPDNWTDCISNTQRYKSIGNGWTIDVIAHILKCAFK